MSEANCTESALRRNSLCSLRPTSSVILTDSEESAVPHVKSTSKSRSFATTQDDKLLPLEGEGWYGVENVVALQNPLPFKGRVRVGMGVLVSRVAGYFQQRID
jgi:hypothetical protein